MVEEEEGPLPDYLRCSRTDGRQWRCSRRVTEGKKLCAIHHLQLRHRQHKEKVPDSLKLKRKRKRTANRVSEPLGSSSRIRVKTAKKMKQAVAKKAEEEAVGASEALDKALKKMKLRKGDLQLDLIRTFLQTQAERRRCRELGDGCRIGAEGELMRDLPNGVMAIASTSSSSPQRVDNAGPFEVKIGAAPASSFTQRRFRSKNIEPPPIGTMQVLPYAKSQARLRRIERMKCHWCQKGVVSWKLIKCSSCKKEVFCMECIKQQYFGTEDEVRLACPVCRRACNCKACLLTQSRDVECKDILSDKEKVHKTLHCHYLICLLLPVLEQLIQDQTIELELEARIKGKAPSECQIQQADSGSNKKCCCHNCENAIVDLHRSCPECSYKLCLQCCQELRQGSLYGGAKVQKWPTGKKSFICPCEQLPKNNVKEFHQGHSKKSNSSSEPSSNGIACIEDYGIACPPVGYGGCGDGLLELRRVYPLSWMKDLETSAEEIVCCYDFPETPDTSSCCSLCAASDPNARGRKQLEASCRKESSDNFLYCPSVLDSHRDNLEHFQKHWARAHPVIIGNVISSASELSWDPVLLICTYIEKSGTNPVHDYQELEGNNCLDWCEVEIGIRKSFSGSFKGQSIVSTQHETLKLKGCLSSDLFQKHFPAHYDEIICALPLQEYLNPYSGLLNLGTSFNQGHPEADLGPCIHISYGCSEEHMQPDSVTKLCYDSNDVVNILVHCSENDPIPSQLSKIKKLIKRYEAQEHSSPAKIITSQREANKMTGKSSVLDKNMRRCSLQRTYLHNKDTRVSWPSTVMQEDFKSSVRNGTLAHSNEDDYDSEATILCQGASGSSSEDDELCSELVRNSSSFKKKSGADTPTPGAQWDVFRRQDVPKLLEYLKRHCNEFRHMYGFPKHVVHPLLDKIFFLDTIDKLRLKEEYNIEPWTFEQQLGEAIVIPAGCPYQIKSLKSHVNVVIDFVSPENVTECIRLIDDLRLLPDGHRAKKGKLEVKKMTVSSISAAIKEIRKLSSPE